MLDVCLLVDRTPEEPYPGAPAFAAELIEGLPTFSFGLVEVAPTADLPREPRYPSTDNLERLVRITTDFPELASERTAASPGRLRRALGAGRRARRNAFDLLEAFYLLLPERLRAREYARMDAAIEVLAGRGPLGLSVRDLLFSRESLDLCARLCERFAPAAPFGEVLRAVRSVHLPFLRLLRTELPAAALYHALSSGYAGFLGAVAAHRTGAPLIVTERELETRERRLVHPRSMRASRSSLDPRADPRRSEVAEQLAVHALDLVSGLIYEQASEIVSLFEEGRRLKILRGAPAARCSVVPDGVDYARYAGLRTAGRPIAEKNTVLVALVAPIAPRSDVKTFLRTAKLLVERLDLVEILVVGQVGATDPYYRECLFQAELLGLGQFVRFTGCIDPRELFTNLDCLVLTSIDEEQPLVLVEAMAAGIPCVATDVGAVRELLEGGLREDRALGPSGVVCPIGDQEAIAAAVERCVRDLPFRERLAEAGMERARRYYRREDTHAAYRALYERCRDRFLSGDGSSGSGSVPPRDGAEAGMGAFAGRPGERQEPDAEGPP